MLLTTSACYHTKASQAYKSNFCSTDINLQHDGRVRPQHKEFLHTHSLWLHRKLPLTCAPGSPHLLGALAGTSRSKVRMFSVRNRGAPLADEERAQEQVGRSSFGSALCRRNFTYEVSLRLTTGLATDHACRSASQCARCNTCKPRSHVHLAILV